MSSPFTTLRLRLGGPNPLRRGAVMRVEFGLGERRDAVPARVRVFDAQGREVRDLFTGTLSCGAPMAVSWDGFQRDGTLARAGLYVIALESGAQRTTARLVLLP